MKGFNLADALLDLVVRINAGEEYPDAYTDIVCSYDLNTNQARRLQDAYDAYQEES